MIAKKYSPFSDILLCRWLHKPFSQANNVSRQQTSEKLIKKIFDIKVFFLKDARKYVVSKQLNIILNKKNFIGWEIMATIFIEARNLLKIDFKLKCFVNKICVFWSLHKIENQNYCKNAQFIMKKFRFLIAQTFQLKARHFVW